MKRRHAKAQVLAVIIVFNEFEILTLVHSQLIDKAQMLPIVVGKMVGKQGTDVSSGQVGKFKRLYQQWIQLLLSGWLPNRIRTN